MARKEKKPKKPKIIKRKSLRRISGLTTLLIIATVIFSILGFLFMFSEAGKTFAEIQAIPDAIKILFLPLTIVIYIVVIVFEIFRYALLFSPILIVFVLHIICAVLVKSASRGGKYCYEKGFNRRKIKTSVVLYSIAAVINIVGIILMFTTNFKILITSTQFRTIYVIALGIIAVFDALFIALCVLDYKKGIKLLKADGIKTDTEIKEERKKAAESGAPLTEITIEGSENKNAPADPSDITPPTDIVSPTDIVPSINEQDPSAPVDLDSISESEPKI